MKPRRAFTLIEVLVALVLMGVGAAALTTAISGDHQLRQRAAESGFAAGAVRVRLELLASRRCSADASGAAVSVLAVERWRAQVSPPLWRLTDSIIPRSPSAPIVIEARVACPA